MDYLRDLVLILICTAVASHYCKRFNVPAVIGELLVGVILGPALLGFITTDNFITMFAEIGVIILMFIAGLESNLELLKHYLLQSTSVATFGVIAPVVLIYGLGRLFHFNNEEAIFLGVTFAATSVSISVEVLKELHKLDSKEGTTILGAAVIDDIMAIVILSVLVSIFSDVGAAQSDTLAGSNLWLGFGLQVLYFVFIYLAFKFLVPILMTISTKIQSTASVVLMAVVISLGMAYLASLFGLSAVLGSFFAGIAIGQTKFKEKVDTEIEPIGYAVFIPVFFVSIGLNMTFNNLLNDLKFIVPLLVLALITKWIGCGFGAKILGMSMGSSSIIGSGMVSRGEMALIVAQTGFSAHLLSSEYYSGVIIVIILTTIIAPFMLKYTIKKEAGVTTSNVPDEVN